MDDRLRGLLRRIGLDRAEVAERCRFLDWRTEDAERLGAMAEAMEPAHGAFVDSLYQHLGRFEAPLAILGGEEVVTRLKHSQLGYYRRLWLGPYDRDYVADRLNIGLIHQRVGVEPKWYLGAYRLYLDHMLARLLCEHPAAATCASLLKVVFFDMTLAIDTYIAAQRQALEDSEARFARALRGANDGLWDWDIETDRLYLSERWTGMLGLPADSLSADSAAWLERVHPEDLPPLRDAIAAHLRGETASLHHEYRIRRHDGDYAWVLVRGVAEASVPGSAETGRRVAGSQTDISQRKAAEE